MRGLSWEKSVGLEYVWKCTRMGNNDYKEWWRDVEPYVASTRVCRTPLLCNLDECWVNGCESGQEDLRECSYTCKIM